MDFIKKHYEKVILGIVLLGLLVLVALLPAIIDSKKYEHQATRQPKVAQIAELDLSAYEAALQRVQPPANINFGLPHNLFNPVSWETAKDGRRFRHRTGGETGIRAIEITAVKPYYFGVAYENTTATGSWIVITNQTSSAPPKRSAMTTNSPAVKFDNTPMVKVDKQPPKRGPRSEGELALLEVDGPADNPTNLAAQVKSVGEPPQNFGPFNFGPNRPYQRIIGYMANLKYDPDGLAWDGERQNDTITVDGEKYNIVSITPTGVVFSAESNKKRTPIDFKPAN